jgi:hypothetical protein
VGDYQNSGALKNNGVARGSGARIEAARLGGLGQPVGM